MTNNDILRRLRFSFNLSDKQVCDIFALANTGATVGQVENWLRKDDDKDQVSLSDYNLASFLNGFIVLKRGKKDGQEPVNEKQLNNNLMLVKLKIALSLQADDIINMLKSVDFNLGKSELSAFFRKPDHRHYRECKDQVLRNFLKAVQQRFRPISEKGGSNKAAAKPHSKPTTKAKDKLSKNGARPSKGKVYVNPNAQQSEKQSEDKKRKTLKLSQEKIWGSTK